MLFPVSIYVNLPEKKLKNMVFYDLAVCWTLPQLFHSPEQARQASSLHRSPVSRGTPWQNRRDTPSKTVKQHLWTVALLLQSIFPVLKNSPVATTKKLVEMRQLKVLDPFRLRKDGATRRLSSIPAFQLAWKLRWYTRGLAPWNLQANGWFWALYHPKNWLGNYNRLLVVVWPSLWW